MFSCLLQKSKSLLLIILSGITMDANISTSLCIWSSCRDWLSCSLVEGIIFSSLVIVVNDCEYRFSENCIMITITAAIATVVDKQATAKRGDFIVLYPYVLCNGRDGCSQAISILGHSQFEISGMFGIGTMCSIFLRTEPNCPRG